MKGILIDLSEAIRNIKCKTAAYMRQESKDARLAVNQAVIALIQTRYVARIEDIGRRGGTEMKDMELKDTIELMISEDYQDRFKAEYHQLRIRFNKLEDYIVKIANKKEKEPKTPLSMLMQQAEIMNDYIVILERRAEIEGIDIGAGANEEGDVE